MFKRIWERSDLDNLLFEIFIYFFKCTRDVTVKVVIHSKKLRRFWLIFRMCKCNSSTKPSTHVCPSGSLLKLEKKSGTLRCQLSVGVEKLTSLNNKTVTWSQNLRVSFIDLWTLLQCFEYKLSFNSVFNLVKLKQEVQADIGISNQNTEVEYIHVGWFWCELC